jgi:hypothetical protein
MTDSPQQQPSLISHLDNKVSSNWRSVSALKERPAKMALGDRIFYWLLSLAGLGITVVGIAICWFLHRGGLGGMIIGVGIGIFAIGPSQAARKGYRI